jgi:glycosyltransferase involved in cell wall biosynthesis
MRVAMVGTFGMRPKMTMSRRALPLARALVRRGHAVTIIVPPWDFPDDAGSRDLIDGVEIVNTDLPSGTPGLWYGQLTAALLRATLATRPDVIHAFKPKGFSGMLLAALLAARRAGLVDRRLVLDTDDWEGRGGWNSVNPYPLWQRWVFTAQEESLLRQADAVTAASRELARMTAARRGDRTVYYVPNGVGDELSDQQHLPSGGEARSYVIQRHGVAGDRPLLLLYTRFVEYRLGRLIELLRVVGSHLPDATLLVVGTGLLGQERELARLTEQQDFGLKIVQAGWVEQGNLPRYFAAADAALFPMDDTLLNRTKCPMKLVDLLTAGVPVIAERIGQVPEYLEDGVSGVLVPSGDHEAFAAALASVACSPAEGERLGQNARARLREHFNWDRLADRAERAYRGQRPE